MTYHPTECIIDLLAASGAQETYNIHRECSVQCTAAEFAETNTIGEHHAASWVAVVALENAGLIAYDGDTGSYDLTDKCWQHLMEDGQAGQSQTENPFHEDYDHGTKLLEKDC